MTDNRETTDDSETVGALQEMVQHVVGQPWGLPDHLWGIEVDGRPAEIHDGVVHYLDGPAPRGQVRPCQEPLNTGMRISPNEHFRGPLVTKGNITGRIE